MDETPETCDVQGSETIRSHLQVRGVDGQISEVFDSFRTVRTNMKCIPSVINELKGFRAPQNVLLNMLIAKTTIVSLMAPTKINFSFRMRSSLSKLCSV